MNEVRSLIWSRRGHFLITQAGIEQQNCRQFDRFLVLNPKAGSDLATCNKPSHST